MSNNDKGRSPYKRKNKTPYPYVHGRCAHKETHTEKVRGNEYVVCNVCNTIIPQIGAEDLKAA